MPIEKTHEFRRPSKEEAADFVRRATIAWLQDKSEGSKEVPNARSTVRVARGLGYVVLNGASGVLAVYRIRPDNLALRRMKRWPESIEG